MKTTPTRLASRLGLVATTMLLGACSSMGTLTAGFSQDHLPDTIKVPAGHKVAWETVGSVCRIGNLIRSSAGWCRLSFSRRPVA